MRLLFATTNKAKLAEVSPIASSLGVCIEGLGDYMTRANLANPPAVAEVGATYYENATTKARAYAAWSTMPCIADDSGIEVTSVNGLPGVYTAAFGVSRLRELLLPGVPYEATFRCCMCFADTAGRRVSVEGVLDGLLCFSRGVEAPASSVPYSYFFTPVGESETLAALTARGGFLSHRTKALASLLKVLDF